MKTESRHNPTSHPGMDLWIALWRKRLAAGLFLLGVVGFVVVYTFLTKPVYEAQTKIVFEQVQEPIPTFDLSGAFARKSYLVNQIEEIKTFALAEEVARALPDAIADSLLTTAKPRSFRVKNTESEIPNPTTNNQQPATSSELRRFEMLTTLIMKSLSAEPIRDSDVILIKAHARTPGAARVLANTTAEVVKDRNVSVKREQASSTRKFIEEQLPKVEGELRKDEEALMAFKAQNQVVSLSDEAKELLVRTTQVGTEHATAQAERQAAEQRLTAIKEQMKTQRASVVPSITTTTSAWADDLRKMLLSQQVEYTNLLVKGYTKDHPQMKKLAAEIEATKQKLTSEVLRVAQGESMENPMSRVADLSREALTLEIDIQTDSTREASLGAILSTYDRQMERLPNKELQLARLTRSQQVNDNIYRLLLEKYEEARITEAGKIGNVRILDPARLPKFPVKPRKLLNLLMALIVGGVGATFLAAFLEQLDKSLKTPEEAENIVGLPVIGLIPSIGELNGKAKTSRDIIEQISSRLVTHFVPRSPVAEAYRTIRTNLSFSRPDSPPKNILVTSAAPHEGKSTTAANLAITLAQMGTKTLLVDSDLRRPTLGRIFNIEGKEGLTELLIGKGSLEALVRPTGIPNLFLLPSGHLPPNPSELLGSQRMKDLMAEISRRYEMAFLDSPPVVAVTDPAVLSQNTDGVVLVVESGTTDREAVLRARTLLDNVKANLLGIVMNNVQIENTYGSYHYHYYYHHYYGEEGKGKKRS